MFLAGEAERAYQKIRWKELKSQVMEKSTVFRK